MSNNKPPAASREVVVAVHECLETLKTDKNAHNLGRAAKLLVKLAYLKTPNRFHIAKQNERKWGSSDRELELEKAGRQKIGTTYIFSTCIAHCM